MINNRNSYGLYMYAYLYIYICLVVFNILIDTAFILQVKWYFFHIFITAKQEKKYDKKSCLMSGMCGSS